MSDHKKKLNITPNNNLGLTEGIKPKLASDSSIYLNNTFKQVDEILDYTDEEKKQIDELMKIVNEIDDLIESGKPYANTFVYNKFIISYKKIDDRIKKHFLLIYNDLVIRNSIFKINRIITGIPLNILGYDYDNLGIIAEIINILSIDNNFDFGIFDNDLVNKLAEEIKNK